MDYKEEYYEEIDLKDLTFYVLRRWRSVLLAGIIFCLLLGGYKAARNAALSAEDLVPQKIKDYEYEYAVYELDKYTYEQKIEDCAKLLEHQNTYMEKSVLMHTDPYRKPTATVDIFVKLDSAEWEGLPANVGLDPTDSVLKAYTSNLWANLDWQPIESLTSGEKLYLEELLGASVDYNSNSFTVWAVYSDGETAQEILSIVLEQVLARQPDVAAGVGRHTITVGNCMVTYGIDNTLAESQRNNMAAITNYERSILEQRMELEELQEPNKPFVIGFVKYPITGLILGVFLAIVFHGAAYLLGGKLHGEQCLHNRYGYVLLGIVPCPQRKGLLSKVDCFLDRLYGASTESEEEVYRRIALNLLGLVGGEKRILVTGTVSFEKLQALAGAISQHLEETELVPAADMSLNASTLEALAGCDVVLLAEEEGKSRIFRIRKEHDCIAALGKSVVGYVLL